MQKINRIDRKKKMVSQLEELSSQIISDPEKLKMFSKKWRAGFHLYSLQNTLIAWCQYPDISILASYPAWQKLKRYVKKGEHAIWIFAPIFYKSKAKEADLFNQDEELKEEAETLRGFIPVPVFDYNQTEGEELDLGANSVSYNGNLTVEDVDSLFNIPVEYKQDIRDGYTDGKKIVIAKRKNKAQELMTYFHELTHILRDHRGKNKSMPKEERELEAEAVAYVVGSCLGLVNGDSGYYLGSFGATPELVKKHSVKIIKCADKILRKITKSIQS